MVDRFDNVPAPDAGELDEFERLAIEAPQLSPDDNAGALHNQFRLVVPRLVKEIRRLRDLLKLEKEAEQLRDEKLQRTARGGGSFAGYGEAADRMAAELGKKKRIVH